MTNLAIPANEDFLNQQAIDQIQAISSEGFKEHALSRLAQIAVKDSVQSDYERLTHEEHIESASGVTELTREISSEIATDLKTAHDSVIASRQSEEDVPREIVWGEVLNLQKSRILEAKEKGDHDEVIRGIKTYLVTVEFSAQEADEGNFTPDEKTRTISRGLSLEPLLEQGLAEEVIEAARASYGLVITSQPSSGTDRRGQPREPSIWEHASVAHTIQAIKPDLEAGLARHISLDPDTPAMTEMSQEEWQEKVSELGTREATEAAIIMSKQSDGPEKEEQKTTLVRRAIDAINEEEKPRDDFLNQADVVSIQKLAQVDPEVRGGPKYENEFRGIRIGREVGSPYRSNNGYAARRDSLAVGLVEAGSLDIATRLITANKHDAGDADHPGVLFWSVSQGEDRDKVFATISDIVSKKRELLNEQVGQFIESCGFEGGDSESRVRRVTNDLIEDAHDPETVLQELLSVLPEFKKTGYERTEEFINNISPLQKPQTNNGEVFINVLERVSAAGLPQDGIITLTDYARETGANSLGTTDQAIGLVEALDELVVQDLLNSKYRREIMMAIKSHGLESVQTLTDLADSEFGDVILKNSSDPLRITYDIVQHFQQWQGLKVPEGLDPELALMVVAKRLELRFPETGEFVEQPSRTVALLEAFEIPQELKDDLAYCQKDFIYSVVHTAGIDKLPSPKKEAKLKILIPDDNLRQLYIDLYKAKQENPDLDSSGVIDYLSQNGYEEGLTWIKHGVQSQEVALPSEVLKRLKAANQNIKQYTDGRNRWLKEFAGQTISTTSLTRAWASRLHALKDGVADNPTAIGAWARENALKVYLNEVRSSDPNAQLPTDEELQAHATVIEELSRVYPPEKIAQGLMRYIEFEKAGILESSKMEATETQIVLGESTYDVEILGKTDARGMTIGEDTGCCMTLGGAAESCVWAGYEDERYGFFAVSTGDRVRAQSVMYIARNSQGDNVLVLDNIETNSGTDLKSIREVYTRSLKRFIAEGKIKVPIVAVHVGIGYTQEELLKDLELAEAVESPVDGIYTDARVQRVLFKVD